MTYVGKKRTRQQRTGKIGEDAFRTFAHSVGLIPSRPEDDYGLDFLCLSETKPNYAGTSEITGSIVGVAVRSSDSKRGKIFIKRSDAEHLLRCEFPTCICLVHLRNPEEPTLYLSLVDERLGNRLVRFLRGSAGKLALTPSDLLSEATFKRQLARAFENGFVERVRIQIAEEELHHVVGHSRIRIRRNATGAVSLVRINNFFGQFDLREDAAKAALDVAIFGWPKLTMERLARLQPHPVLLSAIERLPMPVVFEGALPAGGETTVTVHGTEVACTFEVRMTPTHTGFVHSSGFALTFSDRMLHEDQYVHFLQTRIDPELPIDLRDHPDLWRLLEACKPGAKLVLGDSARMLEVDAFGELVQFGFYARYLRNARKHNMPLEEFTLADGAAPECLNSLAWLDYVFSNPKSLEGIGLVHHGAIVEKATREPSWFALPIVVNLPRRAAVTWLDCYGDLLRDGDWIVGVHVREIRDVRLELLAQRINKTDAPEVVITPEWRSASIADRNEGRIAQRGALGSCSTIPKAKPTTATKRLRRTMSDGHAQFLHPVARATSVVASKLQGNIGGT